MIAGGSLLLYFKNAFQYSQIIFRDMYRRWICMKSFVETWAEVGSGCNRKLCGGRLK